MRPTIDRRIVSVCLVIACCPVLAAADGYDGHVNPGYIESFKPDPGTILLKVEARLYDPKAGKVYVPSENGIGTWTDAPAGAFLPVFEKPGAAPKQKCTLDSDRSSGKMSCGLVPLFAAGMDAVSRYFVLKSSTADWYEVLEGPASGRMRWLHDEKNPHYAFKVIPLTQWLTGEEFVASADPSEKLFALHAAPDAAAAVIARCPTGQHDFAGNESGLIVGYNVKGSWVDATCARDGCRPAFQRSPECGEEESAAIFRFRREMGSVPIDLAYMPAPKTAAQNDTRPLCPTGWLPWVTTRGTLRFMPDTGPGCD